MPRLLLAILILSFPLFAESGFSLQVIKSRDGLIMTRPYTTPQLAYRVRRGKPGNYLHDCVQVVETHDRVDHQDDVVVVKCADEVELELKGVYLR